MQVKFENGPDFGVISVEGEVNILNQNDFKNIFTEAFSAGQYRLVIDFSKTRYIDSSAISVIITARNMLISKGGEMVFAALPQTIEKVFMIIGFKGVVKFFENAEKASEYFTPKQ